MQKPIVKTAAVLLLLLDVAIGSSLEHHGLFPHRLESIPTTDGSVGFRLVSVGYSAGDLWFLAALSALHFIVIFLMLRRHNKESVGIELGLNHLG